MNRKKKERLHPTILNPTKKSQLCGDKGGMWSELPRALGASGQKAAALRPFHTDVSMRRPALRGEPSGCSSDPLLMRFPVEREKRASPENGVGTPRRGISSSDPLRDQTETLPSLLSRTAGSVTLSKSLLLRMPRFFL